MPIEHFRLLFKLPALLAKPRYFNTRTGVLRSDDSSHSFTKLFQSLKDAYTTPTLIIKEQGLKLSELAKIEMEKVEKTCEEIGVAMGNIRAELEEHNTQLTKEIGKDNKPTIKARTKSLEQTVHYLAIQTTEDKDSQGQSTLKAKVAELETQAKNAEKATQKTKDLEDRLNTLEVKSQKLEFKYDSLKWGFFVLIIVAIILEKYRESMKFQLRKIVDDLKINYPFVFSETLAIKQQIEIWFPVLVETEETIRTRLETWFPSLNQQAVQMDYMLNEIVQEIQRLQIKYNDTYSASWYLSWACWGYAHQTKMLALVELEKEARALAMAGHYTITSDDFSYGTCTQLFKAYNTPTNLTEEDEVFRDSLQRTFRFSWQ